MALISSEAHAPCRVRPCSTATPAPAAAHGATHSLAALTTQRGLCGPSAGDSLLPVPQLPRVPQLSSHIPAAAAACGLFRRTPADMPRAAAEPWCCRHSGSRPAWGNISGHRSCQSCACRSCRITPQLCPQSAMVCVGSCCVTAFCHWLTAAQQLQDNCAGRPATVMAPDLSSATPTYP